MGLGFWVLGFFGLKCRGPGFFGFRGALQGFRVGVT